MSELFTQVHLELLTNLAVKNVRNAEQAAEIGLFGWACAMAGAGIEAGILAHACICEPELRAAGRWRETKKAPLDWTFEDLIQAAVAMKWLPTASSLIGNEPIDKLEGDTGDAVRFVQYARNLAVHAGRHVHDMPWLESLGRDEYTITYGVARGVFTHLYKALEALGANAMPQ